MSRQHNLPATLTTRRLALTPPSASHIQAIAQLANNRAVHEMMARLPFPYTEADARVFVQEIAPSDAEHCYAVLLDGSTFVGIIGLHFLDGLAPELGYWLGQPYWGNGYATEAGTAVVEAAKHGAYPSLRSRALLHNQRSRNVLRKLGFVEAGETIEPANNLTGQKMVQMRLDFGGDSTP